MIRRKLINFPNNSCDYRIGPDALEELGSFAKVVAGVPKRAVIVTDTALATGVGISVSRALTDAGFRVSDLSLPANENICTLAYALQLFNALDDTGITSDDLIVALGDVNMCGLTLFCGRSWCGGTSTVLLPTTLDAMVTVATSSKALDTSSSVQMVSYPAHPSMVVSDTNLVFKAPIEARLPGYVELLASSLMSSRHNWDRFGELIEGIVNDVEADLSEAVSIAQTSRLAVVKGSNPSARSGMLYGVTTARALRSCLGPSIPWYRLLAEGMRFEARLAVETGKLSADEMFEQDDRLLELGIEELPFSISSEQFISALRETRFKRANRFMFALPQKVGAVRLSVVDNDVLERHVHAYLSAQAELLDADDN